MSHKAADFCRWLAGWYDGADTRFLDLGALRSIESRLAPVLAHAGDDSPSEARAFTSWLGQELARIQTLRMHSDARRQAMQFIPAKLATALAGINAAAATKTDPPSQSPFTELSAPASES